MIGPDGFTRLEGRQTTATQDPKWCSDCGHIHTPTGCLGSPTPSDLWAGVNPSDCDCAGADSYRDAFFLVFERCNELKTEVAEHQHNALEMARKADLAERRAEEAEYHVEQLRDARDSAERSAERIEARAVELATERDAALARIARAERLIDSWDHDAPQHSNPVFIGRLREVLQRDPAPVRLRGLYTSIHAPESGCMTEHSPPESGHDDECTEHCGEHQWLDRPESDTRECLICGIEVAG